MVDYFERSLALDSDGKPVPYAEATVYDETGTTPLAFTVDGVPETVLKASVNGIYPQFSVDGDPHKVMLVTDEVSNLRTSEEGKRGEKGDPGPAGAGIPPLDTGIPGQWVFHAGDAAVWADGPAGGGGGAVSWDSIPDKPSLAPAQHSHEVGDLRRAGQSLSAVVAALLAAGDVQAARAVLQAAPSSVVSFPGFGTTAGTAMPGNRTFPASEIAFTPVGAISATTVQQGMEQLAALAGGGGGGGAGTSSVLVRRWASGGYPALPVTKPAGVEVVQFIGPSIPTAGNVSGGIPSWVGNGASQIPASLDLNPALT